MENAKFYPESKELVIDTQTKSENIRFVLEGASQEISQDEVVLRLAFPSKLAISSPETKEMVKQILSQSLDVASFNITDEGDGRAVVTIPVSMPEHPLEIGDEEIKIPILVKLTAMVDGQEYQYKCVQEIILAGESDEQEPEPEQEVEPGEDDSYEDDPDLADQGMDDEGSLDSSTEDSAKMSLSDKDESFDAVGDLDLYSGLLAVDYGTSNSSVAVRDPSFAAEEVRGQLGSEQWSALCEWMNIWLSNHLESVTPSDLDIFVHSLTTVVPGANIPECGSPRTEITQALNSLGDKERVQVLGELITRLSSTSRSAGNANSMKTLATETMEGFEAVIDCNNLESQRYFVLELDKDIGPGPISSVLQVLSAPQTEDAEQLAAETRIDMGARVGLLLHSAALGEIDIRQFVLSGKRYFGRDEVIELVPAEMDGSAVQFPADMLAKLTYKELFSRAVEDIHRRAEQGNFQDARWPRSVVATFPTSYPAALRNKIREILEELEVTEVDTRFDEATAAAMYYIWREIGADPVCGMHGLMARCRKDRYNRAYQNVLLYDLGGGTTDIALIQLIYEEVEVFKGQEDRGNGGCYFRITPRLLGTTGHRHLGGDLLTLWVFRFLKAKLADLLLTKILQSHAEPPMDSPISQLLVSLPEELLESAGEEDGGDPQYLQGSLLEWTIHPMQRLQEYNRLNEQVIDVLIPTRFINDSTKVSNFFTLWEIADELKKTLGTPIIENFGTCLGQGLADKWPEEMELDSGQLYNFIQMIHPWLTDSGTVTQDDLLLVVKQDDMNQVISDTVRQSISLAVSLAQARLISEQKQDRVDRLIFSGLSCNMKVIQDVAHNIFRENDGVFEYDPANVKFDRDSAKTSVSLGACIGRYMESVRVDPNNDKTRQLLRDGYDQIELVIENLFSYLPCRLAYDSLVAMVPIFEQGQELNVKSYWDRASVARTSLKSLRPSQEKFWIYRVDFVGAEPQYLGLINAESVAYENGFEDFRKFREEYLVGFEADAELTVRAFFLPKEKSRIIDAKDYIEPSKGEGSGDLIQAVDNGEEEEYQHVMQKTIAVKEALEDIPIIEAGEPLRYRIKYADGSEKACCISESLHIVKNIKLTLQDGTESEEGPLNEEPFAEFEVDIDESDELTLVCDEDGRLLLMTKCLFEIEISTGIEYEVQNVDYNLDPFCGQH